MTGPRRLFLLAIIAGFLAGLLFFVASIKSSEADHPWEAHGYHFHWCGQIVYALEDSGSRHAALERVLYDTMDRGWGWDALGCGWGGKFLSYWWESYEWPTLYFKVAPSWYVDYYCGVTWAWACAYPWNCYYEWAGGSAVCGFTILMKDWAFDRNPYFIVNHEVGHVLGLGDHFGCGYVGLMNGNACYPGIAWPTDWEWWSAWHHMWYGP